MSFYKLKIDLINIPPTLFIIQPFNQGLFCPFFSYNFLVINMKKILIIILLLIPIKIKAYETSATSAILMEQNNNKIIYAKNIHEKRSIASISKIMTAILALESDKLYETTTVTNIVNKAYGSGIYIKPGEELKLIDLVYGLLLRSGNDAALQISEVVSETEEEFVKLMNKKAKEIGMKNTTFNNPSGLEENGGNISTAYDMALLTSYAMKNETYRMITGTRKYTLKTNMNNYFWVNKNKLLTLYKYTTGGKTGFTEIAKRTLVTTASKDNLNLVAVTLNDGNDFLDHQNLYKEAYEKYKNYEIVKEGPFEIYGENYYNESFYIKESFNYPLTEEEKKNIILKINIIKKETYENNEKIGELVIKLQDNELKTIDIYITKKEKKSFFQKIKEWIINIW